MLDRINSLCVTQGECRIWRGAGATRGKPRVILRNKTMDARRALLWAHTGINPKAYARYAVDCGNGLCLNLAHVRLATANSRDGMPAWDFAVYSCDHCRDVRARLGVLAPSTNCCGFRMRVVKPYESGDLTRLRNVVTALPLSDAA